MVTREDYADAKESMEFGENRIPKEEIKYNFCPSYYGLKDRSCNNIENCGVDIEDCFLCWEDKITEKELDKYNELE